MILIKTGFCRSTYIFQVAAVDAAVKMAASAAVIDHLGQSHKPCLIVQRSQRVRDRGLQGLEIFLEPTL
ncbi:hypothetical protein INR49_030355 [Caranx melampygus]|nr:hypothetical protein INR49_030355 [Caranx melampygus]